MIFLNIPFILVSLLVLQLVEGSCDNKVNKCKEKNPTRPVCGSDGVSYPTRCHLLRAACDGSDVVVVHRGNCGNEPPCFQVSEFIPHCRTDGSYSPVQCHQPTGYCWCVNRRGKPLRSTAVRNARPNCGKGKLRRGGNGTRKLRQRKGCGKFERANFINNLIRSFTTEYNRIPTILANVTDDAKAKLAVVWKFNTLDKDGNKTLSKDEFKDLRKLVRKAIKPKKCARSFTRYCDADSDGFLSEKEWMSCLEKRAVKRNKGRKKKNKEKKLGVLHKNVPILGAQDLGIDDPIDRKDEPESNDCWTDRKSVMEEQAGGIKEMYVPECMPDGRYNKIQCYLSTGYCWCVHQDTGKPIPGTSKKDPHPNCDAVQPPSRPMKGCPEHRKLVFLKELMEFLKIQMQNKQTTNLGEKTFPLLSEDQISPKDQQIAAWHFQDLDINKNKMLERKEWKAFRAIVSTEKRLRRCGKKLPRYCDVNHDRKISMTEWINCLKTQNETIRPAVTPSPKRRGPNPLESFLKDD